MVMGVVLCHDCVVVSQELWHWAVIQYKALVIIELLTHYTLLTA